MKNNIIVQFPVIYTADHIPTGKRTPRRLLMVEVVPVAIPVIADEDFPVVARVNLPVMRPGVLPENRDLPITHNIGSVYKLDIKRDIDIDTIDLRVNEDGLLMAPMFYGANPSHPDARKFIHASLVHRSLSLPSLIYDDELSLGCIKVIHGNRVSGNTLSDLSEITKEILLARKPFGNESLISARAIIDGAMGFGGIPLFPIFGNSPIAYDLSEPEVLSAGFCDPDSPELAGGERISDNKDAAVNFLAEVVSNTFRASKSGDIYVLSNAPKWERSFGPTFDDEGGPDAGEVVFPMLYPNLYQPIDLPHAQLLSSTMNDRRFLCGVFTNEFYFAHEAMERAATVELEAVNETRLRRQKPKMAQKIPALKKSLGEDCLVFSSDIEALDDFYVIPRNPEFANGYFKDVELIDPDFEFSEHTSDFSLGVRRVICKRLDLLRDSLIKIINHVFSTVPATSISDSNLKNIAHFQATLQLHIDLNDRNSIYNSNTLSIQNHLKSFATRATYFIYDLAENVPGVISVNDFNIIERIATDLAHFEPIFLNKAGPIEGVREKVEQAINLRVERNGEFTSIFAVGPGILQAKDSKFKL